MHCKFYDDDDDDDDDDVDLGNDVFLAVSVQTAGYIPKKPAKPTPQLKSNFSFLCH